MSDKYLIDSNILIYHLNGNMQVTEFLTANRSACSISRITYIEVMSFNFSPSEEAVVKKFLHSFRAHDLNQGISELAVENRRNKRIKMADNIIASTAQYHNLILVTRNVKDYRSLESLIILNPFSDWNMSSIVSKIEVQHEADIPGIARAHTESPEGYYRKFRPAAGR
ncbi:type II toxin-antitoxin system VapC family toxin [Spirochaeta dissipatitropha]